MERCMKNESELMYLFLKMISNVKTVRGLLKSPLNLREWMVSLFYITVTHVTFFGSKGCILKANYITKPANSPASWLDS
jgi:hypothetical protein